MVPIAPSEVTGGETNEPEGGPAWGAGAAAAAPQLPPCERCGTFAELHPVAGRRLCARCLEHVDAIERTPMGVGTVLAGVLQLLKRIGLASALLLVAIDLPIAAVELLLRPPTMVANIYGLLVSIVGQAAILVMAHGVITGETSASLPSALRLAIGRWPALVGTQILVNLVTIVGVLLCVVPGIIAALGFTVTLNLVLLEHDSGTSALRTSWNHMKGHKATIFGAYLVAALPLLVLLGVFVASAGAMAFTDPEAFARAPEQVPAYRIAEAVFTVLLPAFMTPLVLVPAVAYAKLRVAADAQSLGVSAAGLGVP